MVSEFTGRSSYPKNSAISNVLNFAQLLKSMVPAATTIEVLTAIKLVLEDDVEEELIMAVNDSTIDVSSNEHEVVPDEELIGLFSQTLYTGIKRVVLDLGLAGFKNLPVVGLIPQLCSLSFTSGLSPTTNANLAHKSATTLQRMEVGIRNANMLLYDSSGNAVVYPNLQHLLLHSCIRSQPGVKVNATAAGVVAFPFLKSLRVSSVYPFFTDVLFRGNSATLKHVDFPVDRDTIIMLCSSQSFKHKRIALRQVFVKSSYSSGDLSLIPEVDMNRFLSNLAGNAQKLIFETPLLPEMSISAALDVKGFNNLQEFDTGSDSLSLFKVFALLKGFPALVKLRSKICGLGSEFEHIAAKDLPDYVASTYCNVGSNFRMWHMSSLTSTHATETIEYILLLGLACPKISRIECLSSVIGGYRAKITNALESGPFSRYDSQLGRLVNVFYKKRSS
ncbi:hypothetical protein GGH13_001786 [Coemansia sp. S155-1]|nr:hypothetical protein GGH13_001786 [Coemansia sp. S155-1]